MLVMLVAQCIIIFLKIFFQNSELTMLISKPFLWVVLGFTIMSYQQYLLTGINTVRQIPQPAFSIWCLGWGGEVIGQGVQKRRYLFCIITFSFSIQYSTKISDLLLLRNLSRDFQFLQTWDKLNLEFCYFCQNLQLIR